MTDARLASHLAAWREAEPQFDTAWLFLRPDERVRFGALAALEHDWLKTAREVREPQVAGARLGWWREELQRAVLGQAQHPLAVALFADGHARGIPLAGWHAAIDAVMSSVAAAPPTDFAAQLEAARPLSAAFAELEQHLWFGAPGASPRAVALVTFGGLIASLRALPATGGTPLPMNLLARHGLAIDTLAADCAARRAAVRDQAASLQRGLASAITMPGSTTLLQAVRAQHDLDALQRARRADDPLQALLAPTRGFSALLKTWRAARTWRQVASNRMIE